MGDNRLYGSKMIQDMSARIELIRNRIRVAHDRQKSYSNAKRFFREFNMRNQVLLRVSPMKEIMIFDKGNWRRDMWDHFLLLRKLDL